jgi:predicted HicB family RNase H-like nuclease
VQLQFRLQERTRDRLRAEAKRRNVSVNYLIEQALEERLTTWEKEKLGRKV